MGGAGIRGAMYGSRLYDQPKHAEFATTVREFAQPGPPLNLEIGVDRGYRLLAHARRWPEQRWLGVEVRRTVLAAAQHAPSNALLLRADARAILEGLLPEHRLQRVDILFPSPTHCSRKLLLSPAFVSLLASRMHPSGVLLLATDVPGMADLARELLLHWPEAAPLPVGTVHSRREKVCAQQGRPVWQFHRYPDKTSP